MRDAYAADPIEPNAIAEVRRSRRNSHGTTTVPLCQQKRHFCQQKRHWSAGNRDSRHAQRRDDHDR
jgi:hypothetical protein